MSRLSGVVCSCLTQRLCRSSQEEAKKLRHDKRRGKENSSICFNDCDVRSVSWGELWCIKYLLERRPSLVSERNADNKLPIHLLCEAREDRVGNESTEYLK